MAALLDTAEVDIEERLKAWVGGRWPRDQSLDDDIRDAAVEIYRLRGYVRQIRIGIDPFDGQPPKWATSPKY